MWVFLKICDSHSKAILSGSVTRSRTENHPFPGLCIGYTVSVFTDQPVSGNARLLALKQRGGLPTWETRVTKSSSNCGSQSENNFPLNLLSATIMRMTEGDRHYICPTISRDEFDDPSSSILSRAAPTA
jgi:hypothetical protein